MDKPTTESAAENSTSPDRLSAPFDAVLQRIEANMADPAYQERAARLERQEREQRVAKRTTQWSRIAAGYTSTRLDTFNATIPEQERVKAAVAEFIDTLPQRLELGEGMLLYGPPGTGKDHLALSVLAVAILEHNHTAERIGGPEWFGTIRDAIDTDTPEATLVRRLVEPQWLLVSDPIGPFGGLKEHQGAMLYRVVDERCRRRRPTICTVNVADGKEGAKLIGAPTWSRLRDRAWVIPCNWPDHRQPARVVK